jgi:hypothetical protein
VNVISRSRDDQAMLRCLSPSECNPAKVEVEGSYPFARSSRRRPKLSPPFPGPQKSPIAAGIRASGLGVRSRNERPNLCPKAHFSPKLGAWPIYSTSFFGSQFNSLVSLASRKVGIPFALYSGPTPPANPLICPRPPIVRSRFTGHRRSETSARRSRHRVWPSARIRQGS